MKIYLATPVNARKEKTLHQKMNGALKSIQMMAKYLKKNFDPEFEPLCSFDIPEVWNYFLGRRKDPPSEPFVMGECVRMLMEADMIVLDDGWECSQGCTVERFVAMQYGKQVKTINSFKLAEQLKTK